MSNIGTIDGQQNNLSNPADEQDTGTPPPEYTSQMQSDQRIQSGVGELEHHETYGHESPLENSEQQNTGMPGSGESMMSDTVVKYPLPHLIENQRLSGSVESTQSGTVIQNASIEEITDLAPQQAATSPEQDESSPWVRVLRLVWPGGARQRRKRLIFVGKFEIILGMFFIIFGVASVIVTNQVYERFFIGVYGGVAGYGLLLLIAGSCKACTSPSESNVTVNTIFSLICFFGAGGLAVLCLYFLLNIPPFYNDKWEFPYIMAVAAGTAATTALICLLHVGCYFTGKNIPLERVQIIVSTNTRTGEKFFETLQPQPQYMERSESDQEVNEQSYPGSSQEIMPYHQQGIPMANIGRSTSMRTIQNQYVERTNHELPQQFHTVHRHPITMEQHRLQEMRYATSEFNSNHPLQMSYGKERPLDQPEFVNRHVHSDFNQPRAMTEVNYQQPRTIVGHQYAQSEIGQPRAMTEVDYPQLQTTPHHQYAQSELGRSRAVTEVDYPQSRTILGEQYAHSEIGQPRTATQGDYPQPRTLPIHQFAQSEMRHPRAMTDVDYQQPRTMPSQRYPQSEMGHPRTVTVTDYQPPASTPSHLYARSEVSRPGALNEIGQSPSMQTPNHQYTHSEITHPVTMARYPPHMTEANYSVNMPHMPTGQNIGLPVAHEAAYPPTMAEYNTPMPGRMQQHPQAEMGFRTVPSHQVPYQAAPSEAGYSYTASESGYPSNQAGRISPRMALAERQMRMEAARQESLMRRQPPVRNGSQQYMVATRQYR